MNTKEHKPGDIFVSSILGAEIETVEWDTSKKKDSGRCLVCALYETCKIKEDIEERRKDVGSCSRSSRSSGDVVYFKSTEESKNITKEKRVEQRRVGDKFFSRILGGILEVKNDKKVGRCASCAYLDVCIGDNRDLCRLRYLESGTCSRRFRGDDKPVYFKKIENKYEVSEDVYNLLKEFEKDENLSPEETKGYQQALLDAVYLEINGN